VTPSVFVDASQSRAGTITSTMEERAKAIVEGMLAKGARKKH